MSSSAIRQFSSQKVAGTFSNQSLLEKLPVPELAVTCERYLRSAQAVVSPEQLENTRKIVQGFLNDGVGQSLHSKLVERAKQKDNWLEEWWDSHGYYGARIPLVITTNPGIIMDDVPVVKSLPKPRAQTWRTAQAIHSSLHFMLDIYNNVIPPDNGMCMNQYARLFGTTRVPVYQGIDELINYLGQPKYLPTVHYLTQFKPCEPKHVIVIANGHFFTVDALKADGTVESVENLEAHIESIRRTAASIPSSTSKNVGNFTAIDRDTWAKAREALITASPINAESLEIIQKALFVFVLDDSSPTTSSELAAASMMGKAGMRWFDKHMIIVYANGRCGLNFEHGATDGLTLVRMCDYVNDHSSAKAQPRESLPEKLPTADMLKWVLTPNIEKSLISAAAAYELHAQSVLLRAVDFNSFGREAIKSMKCSPDAFFQMAIQLAYYRLYGISVPTYESAATRKFIHGRTETLRSCTVDSVAWVKSMDKPIIQSERKREIQRSLLRKAIATHSANIRDATDGKGCDRTLLGMQMIASELGIEKPEIFKDTTYSYSRNWLLSTSSMPTNEVVAFGAVTDGGFGVYYCFPKKGDSIKYVVTSYTNQGAPADLLAQTISDSLLEMSALLQTTSAL
eukprot:c8410_g1_i2.p1 GENE.c8410_g1_i2~~c8410_g1_i2.p1  ORF type:complete len:642 (+),score=143.52 c8410_g1_i2:53-1927(+)